MKKLNALLAIIAIILSVYCLGTRSQDKASLDKMIRSAQGQLKEEAFQQIEAKRQSVENELTSTLQGQEKIMEAFKVNRQAVEKASEKLAKMEREMAASGAKLEEFREVSDLVSTLKTEMTKQQASLTSKIEDAERLIAATRVDLQGMEAQFKALKAESVNLDKTLHQYRAILTPQNQGRIADSNKWKDPTKWRALKNGMSTSQVVELLGQPSQASSGFWYYRQDQRTVEGNVYFAGDETLYSWNEPDWEKLK